MNKLTAIVILGIAVVANAVVIGKQEHKKAYAITDNVEQTIDSLVDVMGEFLDKPMSWCEVTPTGFSGTKPVGGARHNGYVSLNVELSITCDNNQLMDVMESIYGNVYEYDSRHRKPVGIMWDGYNSMRFSSAIEQRNPAIRYIWSHGATEMTIHIDNDFASAGNQGSPVLGRLLLNGVPLVDDYIIDHKYGNEWSSPDIFRFMVGDCYVVRVAVESPKVLNAKQLNKEYRRVLTYSASVSYLVRSDKADKLLANENLDVTVERIYNHSTPGTFNRSYHFLGYLN